MSEPLDQETRALAEALFRRMSGPGRWKIELEGEGGHVRRWSRLQGPAGANELEQFDGQPDCAPSASIATVPAGSPPDSQGPPGAEHDSREESA